MEIPAASRCLHCAEWKHVVCIALQEEYNPGSWVCFTCRKLPSHVASLTRDMARLVEIVQGKSSSMTRLQEQHDRAMAQADERHQKLAAENDDLRQRISDLSRPASNDHWHQLKSKFPHGTVVIGSSIIRDISEDKLVATQCICKRGGFIKDLQDALDSLPIDKPFSRIILIGGGNDWDTDSEDLDVIGITAQYRDLVECAKAKATTVTICSVCPWNKTAAVSQRIKSLNAGLMGIASDLSVDFLDNDPMFHLQDGSLNDGYLLADGVYLTRPATNHLVSNMQLSLRKGEIFAYSDHRHKTTGQDSPTQTSVGDTGENYDHPFWWKAQQKALKVQPREQRPAATRPHPAHRVHHAAGPPVSVIGAVPNTGPHHRPTPARWAAPAAKPPTDDATRCPKKSSATALCPLPTPSDGCSHPVVIPTPHPWMTTTSEDLWHSPEPHLPISKTLPRPNRSPRHPLPTMSWLGTFGCHMHEPRIQMLSMIKLRPFCPRMPISTTIGLVAGWSGASCKYWRVPRDITTRHWDTYWLTRHPPPPWKDWSWKWVWCRSFCR